MTPTHHEVILPCIELEDGYNIAHFFLREELDEQYGRTQKDKKPAQLIEQN